MSVVLLVVGLLMIVVGAESLVRGGGRLALLLRVPAVVVGLTLVAWGTSAPELVVSLVAAAQASTDMALGNVLGSSIANIALVLGVAAAISPLPSDHGVRRRDYAVLLASQLALPVMLLDGCIGRLDGALLVTLGILYNVLLVRGAWKHRDDAEPRDLGGVRRSRWPLYATLVVGGVALLAFGSSWFVDGASQIARALGVSDRVIGLTVMAVGTSTPELATSVVAAVRGQHEVSLGNVVGSNLFNTVFALGITAIIFPVEIPALDSVGADIVVVLLLTLALAPLLRLRKGVTRGHGVVLLAVYAAYLTYLVLW